MTQVANGVTDSNGNAVTDSNGNPVTEPSNAVTDSNGNMVTDLAGNIVTESPNHLTDANGITVTDSNGNHVTDPFTVPYSSCPFISLAEGSTACELWCQVQELENDVQCSGMPTTIAPCPYEGLSDSDTLCSLWQQLNILTSAPTVTDPSGNVVTDSNGNPVSQVYAAVTDSNGNVVTDASGNPVTQVANGVTDSNGNVVTDSNGNPVTEPTNVVTDSNGNTVTDLTGNIVTESPNPLTDANGVTVTDSSGNLVTDPFTVSYSSCPFISLAEGTTACQLWCQVQELENNMQCSGMPTTSTQSVTTSATCPYLEYEDRDLLCLLWEQVQTEKESGSTLPSTTYSIPYTSCPHLNNADGFLACQLWCELQGYTSWTVCSNQPICPYENYTAPHDTDLCNLWAENVNIESNIFGSTTPTSLEGLTPLYSTQVSESNTIECIYENNEHKEEYCSIWCETQQYKYGQVCLQETTTEPSTTATAKICPYLSYPSKDVLCWLWEQIETEKEGGSTVHPTTYEIPYSACPYDNLSDGFLACELWCVLHEYAAWTFCTDKPICPYENYTSPHDEELCLLWAENLNIENTLFGSSTPISTDGISPLYTTLSTETNVIECVYESSDFSEDYCNIWCETQFYKYGQICSSFTTSTTTAASTTTAVATCPYELYTDSEVLCYFWQQIQIQTLSGTTLHSSTFGIPYSACPHAGLSDGILACSLWCQHIELTAWTVCEGSPICPYENYTSPHDSQLCELWVENQYLETQVFGTSTTDVSTDGLTPLFSTDSTANQVISCIYEDYDNSAEYCALWCENQFYKYGQTCAEISTTPQPCPYEGYYEAELLCKLHESLNLIGNEFTSGTYSTVGMTTVTNIQVTDASGNVVTDANGNAVTLPANTVTDSSGNTVTDSSGNLVTGKNIRI